ncbi:MAG: slipin family protein [Candidatus Nezhaarchaeota archaeon]|nr:slipin family protein [Candidatus Nezhaarchaeota archaeon]MCX8142439.1 slipin family protein [Candidatus Nezhaarchaeota archaeon]MDW8050588.1 slipin family protein [Nitrososphaerota archaeon]
MLSWLIEQIRFPVGTEIIALILLLFVILIIIGSSIRMVYEYERAVIFRLGRLLGSKGPGLFFRIPIIDKFVKVDLRVVTIDVPKQRIVTKDNVTVDVDAVIYYRVMEPVKAVTAVENYVYATSLLGQTVLRDVIGQSELDELLTKREEINKRLTQVLDVLTDPWGIKVTAVSIKDVSLPESMLRAMAKQAEAERERRARIIVAEGEYQASKIMAEAAKAYQEQPIALRLRELQTLIDVARERNLVIIAPQALGEMATVLGTTMRLSERASEKR